MFSYLPSSFEIVASHLMPLNYQDRGVQGAQNFFLQNVMYKKTIWTEKIGDFMLFKFNSFFNLNQSAQIGMLGIFRLDDVGKVGGTKSYDMMSEKYDLSG